MNINLHSSKFTMDEDQRTYVEKKLERIKYAEDLITDILFNIKFEKGFFAEFTVNFRWGGHAHVKAEGFDFNATVNDLMDSLDTKVRKEKDKIQEKQ